MGKTFEEKLTESLQEVGSWLIEHAGEIASPIPYRKGLNIWINYDWENITPEIQVENEYLCVAAAEKLHQRDGEDQKL